MLASAFIMFTEACRENGKLQGFEQNFLSTSENIMNHTVLRKKDLSKHAVLLCLLPRKAMNLRILLMPHSQPSNGLIGSVSKLVKMSLFHHNQFLSVHIIYVESSGTQCCVSHIHMREDLIGQQIIAPNKRHIQIIFLAPLSQRLRMS